MAKTVDMISGEAQYAAIVLGVLITTTLLTCLGCRKGSKEDGSDDSVILEMESLLRDGEKNKTDGDTRQDSLVCPLPEEKGRKSPFTLVGKKSLTRASSSPLLANSLHIPEVLPGKRMEEIFLAPPSPDSGTTGEEVLGNSPNTSRLSKFGRTIRNIPSNKPARSMEDIFLAPPQPDSGTTREEGQQNNTDARRPSRFGQTIRNISSHIGGHSTEDNFLTAPHPDSISTKEGVQGNNTDTRRPSKLDITMRNISSHIGGKSMEDIFLAPPQPNPSTMTAEVQPNNTDTSRLAKFGRTIRNMSHIMEEIQPDPSDLHPRNGMVKEEDDAVGYTEDVGTLHFSISYDLYDRILKVNVLKAVGLIAKDKNGFSDPYCKVYLVPGKKQKIQTKVIRRNLNPAWHEILTFEGFPLQLLKQRVLRLKVVDFDSFSKDDPIGDVEIALANVKLQAEPIQYIRRLRPYSQSASFRGEILLTLAYNQKLGHIAVTIVKCRNLKVLDSTGKCNPYVKVYTYYSGHRVDKKKTKVDKHGKRNPEWNEPLDFELPLNRVRDVMLVFRVMDFDPVLMNRPIGDALVGYRTGMAQNHWTDMLCQPKTAVSMWHTLEKPKKYGKIKF